LAEKTIKTKQAEVKPAQKASKTVGKEHEKPKKPNAIVRWWRETIGELRKVTWPTVQEARRLTIIVLAVMLAMSVTLGLLDWLFSKLISLLVV
jgi:preprotein translocase subunit SecE